MSSIEARLTIEILLPLLQVGFTVKNLPGGNIQLSVKIGRIDFKQQFPRLDLLIIVDRNVNNRTGNARRDADDIRPDLGISRPRIIDVALIQNPGGPSCQANDDQSDERI